MGRIDKKTRRKLDGWVAAGLISSGQAAAIEVHERRTDVDTSWGILVFAGFGAVVLGLGVILLFAYNWAEMHKFTKLGIVFGSLAAAHGVGVWMRRTRRPLGVSEAAHVLGTMLFGAGIWLVGQIYHISAHYPNAFLVWGLGAALLAWALPSTPQGILGAVLLCAWTCAEAMSFGTYLPLAPVLVLIVFGSLAWVRKSPTLLAISAASFTISAVAGFPVNDEAIFQVVLTIAMIFSALSWLVKGHAGFPSASAVLGVMGFGLYLPLLFILTFLDATEDLLDFSFWRDATLFEWVPSIILGLAAVGAIYLAARRAGARLEVNTPEFRGRMLAPLAIFLAYSALWWASSVDLTEPDRRTADMADMIVTLLANAVFLYHTVAWLWIGCRETRRGLVVSGSLMLAVWTFARFADLFDSLLVRGVVFMAMGGALFAVANIYHRQRRKAAQSEAFPNATGMEG